MWSSITDISKIALRQWKPIVIIYSVQLLLGIVLSFFAYQSFSDAIGNSLELDRLALGFNRSVFSDMINTVPDLIASIRKPFILLLLLYLLASIFLQAGLLGNIKKDKCSISDFFTNGKSYFFSFICIALISIFKVLVSLALIWFSFFKLIGDPLETFHSEKPFILTVLGLIVFSTLLISVIWLWSILSRYQKMEGNTLYFSMKQGWRILKSRLFHYLSIALLFLGLQVFLTWMYTFIVDDWGASAWFYIISLLLIQQCFSFMRIYIRAAAYTSLSKLR